MVDTSTAASGAAAGNAVRGQQLAAAQPVPARPMLADGVRLLGAVQGTGFADSMWLVERPGRFVQLSELLYQVAEECDGSRSVEEIAAAVSAQSKWAITPQQVEFLVGTKLLPLGVLQAAPREPGNDGEDAPQDGVRPAPRCPADGGTTAAGRLLDGVQSPLRLTARRRLLGPGPIEAVSSALRVLFTPPLMGLLLTGVVASRVWLYGLHGLARGITQFFTRPALFIVLVLILLLASIFHEFGHASGLRYGGGRTRGMGVGFYMVFPSLYTDVTGGYRLSRGQRIRTDVGGPYFDLIFSLGVLAGYVATRQEFLLFAVLLLDAEAVRQLLPFKRMDGYWLLADIVGLPDLTSLIRPLLGSLPGVGGVFAENASRRCAGRCGLFSSGTCSSSPLPCPPSWRR